MNDRLLVDAMRSRDPAAIGAVYDAYAERIFAFCWFLLRSREAAEVALRDALIVAGAHIDRLRAPDRLGAWLYALARVECGRRPAPPERRPDIPIASHDQHDVDQRVMAWGAVLSLPRLTRELLELLLRHRLPVSDLAAVLAVSPKEVEATLDRSQAELDAALTAELLAHDGPHGCPDRAAILRARQGELTPMLRARLRRHAADCQICDVFLVEAVSPAKVYGLLPYATPANGLRERVLSCCLAPELGNYRSFVSARTDGFTKSGFPVQRRRGWDRRAPYDPVGGAVGPWRRLLHVIGGLAATAAIAGAVVALVRWAGSVQDRDIGRVIAFRATPTVRAQPTPTRPGLRAPAPLPGISTGWSASSIAPTLPSGVCDPAAPPPLVRSSPLDDRLGGPLGSPSRSAPGREPTERTSDPVVRPTGPSPSSSRSAGRPTGPSASPTTRPTTRPTTEPPSTGRPPSRPPITSPAPTSITSSTSSSSSPTTGHRSTEPTSSG